MGGVLSRSVVKKYVVMLIKRLSELLWHCSTHVQHGGSVALSVGHLKPSVPLCTRQLETVLRIMRQPCGSTGWFFTKLWCTEYHTCQLERGADCDVQIQTIHNCLSSENVLNYVRSNHVSLSKETASLEKSVSFQRAGNVCSHSWLTTQPLFSLGVLRQANVTAEYQGKHHPNPPVHLLVLPAGALVDGPGSAPPTAP